MNVSHVLFSPYRDAILLLASLFFFFKRRKVIRMFLSLYLHMISWLLMIPKHLIKFQNVISLLLPSTHVSFCMYLLVLKYADILILQTVFIFIASVNFCYNA